MAMCPKILDIIIHCFYFQEGEGRDISVLDVNPEAKAILDMAGRTRHSEGIREPPPL